MSSAQCVFTPRDSREDSVIQLDDLDAFQNQLAKTVNIWAPLEKIFCNAINLLEYQQKQNSIERYNYNSTIAMSKSMTTSLTTSTSLQSFSLDDLPEFVSDGCVWLCFA